MMVATRTLCWDQIWVCRGTGGVHLTEKPGGTWRLRGKEIDFPLADPEEPEPKKSER